MNKLLLAALLVVAGGTQLFAMESPETKKKSSYTHINYKNTTHEERNEIKEAINEKIEQNQEKIKELQEEINSSPKTKGKAYNDPVKLKECCEKLERINTFRANTEKLLGSYIQCNKQELEVEQNEYAQLLEIFNETKEENQNLKEENQNLRNRLQQVVTLLDTNIQI